MIVLLAAFVIWLAINGRLANYALAATRSSEQLQAPIPGIE